MHTNNQKILNLIQQLAQLQDIDETETTCLHTEDDIETLLQHKVFNVALLATRSHVKKEDRVWDINKISLLDFLTQNTQWQPLTRSFFEYLSEQEAGVLSEVMQTEDITLAEQQHFRLFLEKQLKE